MSEYPRIEITQGLAGWFAVKTWWNPDGFPEPYSSGVGRYALQSDAIAEGKQWAEDEELPFIMPTVIDDAPARQDVMTQLQELIPGVQIIEIN